VLALSDGALTQLMNAARKIERRRRGPWLRRIARQLEKPASANVRACRIARQRANNGVAVYRLALSAVEIETLLEREGLLPVGIDHAHHSVEAALSAFLTALADFDMSVGFEPEIGL
jgi:hypothetical protein